jgi:hypothetical protein
MSGPILVRRRDSAKPCLIAYEENHRAVARPSHAIFTLVPKSLGFTLFIVGPLFIVGLFRHFAPEGGVSKRREALPKIARLDQSRDVAEIGSNPEGVFDLYPPPKPSQKTPASQTGAYVRLPPKPSQKIPVDRAASFYLPLIAPSQKTPVGLTRQIEVPAPDLTSVSFPERYALDGNLTVLPSPPPIEPTRAMIAEASAGASSADANAVIATLEKYSDAWTTKRVTQITELRPRLPRRTVEQELSSASSIVMRIRPTSVPRIQGNRATVECIHQVDQVFRDGVEKQNPGVKMTYVLVRRGSNWLIEESR